jgi:hypothetical protein
MGQTAAPWTLPYPEQGDPADVPTDLRELADRLQIHLDGLDSRLDAVEASAGSFVLLADQRLAAPAANIDFSNIPQTYSQLRLAVTARTDSAVVATTLFLALNGAVTNYDFQRVAGSGAANLNAEGIGGVQGIGISNIPGANAPANQFTQCDVVCLDYTGAAHQAQVLSTFYRKITNASGDMMSGVYGGTWRSLAAVNRLTIVPQTGNLIAGSRATLYGLRGLVP